jgi:hypothetical protein
MYGGSACSPEVSWVECGNPEPVAVAECEEEAATQAMVQEAAQALRDYLAEQG